ncbi:hypothetical protein DUNSADRAFT_15893 [Dunaliella salina]|uniref:Uncharacterized protein n=1 Tax=Dunaliella salina TaxID=3046 RepID=A0ABQ7G4N9_DUNSA|nr:hypothetical protein DUNSADRAFT_15893 [Dunaliella salina]|eukprot:KAF5829566.1 hypothetical protein DUNSADRAFT_15893 [Dunaliella salina]
MALPNGTQAEMKKAASRGLGQHALTAQSPASTNTGRHDAVTRQSVLKKLGSVKLHLDASLEEHKGNSDDEADIFPSSMGGKFPGTGRSPGSVIEEGRRRSLGGQALLTSQSLVQQVNGPDGSQKSEGSAMRRASLSQQHIKPDSWFKLDLLDKGLGIEEEDFLARVPTGNSVPDVVWNEFEIKSKRVLNSPPPSQKGLLERLERRFQSGGQLQLNVHRNPSSPNGGPRSPSSPNDPRGLSFSSGPSSPNDSRSLSSSNAPSSPHDPRSRSFSNGLRSEALKWRKPAPSLRFQTPSLPAIVRPVGTQPIPPRSQQSTLKPSKSLGALGGGSPNQQKQPSFARRSSREGSAAVAAAVATVGAAAAAKRPYKSQVADALGSLLQDA